MHQRLGSSLDLPSTCPPSSTTRGKGRPLPSLEMERASCSIQEEEERLLESISKMSEDDLKDITMAAKERMEVVKPSKKKVKK